MTKIPDFHTVEEAAEFWDEHDSTPYLEEMEPVSLTPHLRRDIFHPHLTIVEDSSGLQSLCPGKLAPQQILYGDWNGERLLVIRDVPAWACQETGRLYMLAETAEQIDRLLDLDEEEQLETTETMTVPVVRLQSA